MAAAFQEVNVEEDSYRSIWELLGNRDSPFRIPKVS